MWLWILIGLSIVTKVHGYANGRVPESCQTMLPKHRTSPGGGFAPPQDSVPPFDIDVGEIIYGAPLTVNLKSEPTSYFRGFMLEARRENMVEHVGKFILLGSDGTQLLPCVSAGASYEAVTHTTNNRKNLIQVNWTAEGEVDTVTFRATFVQSFSRFWTQVEKDVRLPTTTSPPTTTSTQSSTITSTTVASTTNPSSTTSTTMTSTTNPSSTTSTTMTSTTNPSSTTSTTMTSTTMTSPTNTADPSRTTNTTMTSPTNTADPSRTTSTTITSPTNTADPSRTPSATMTSPTNPSSATSATVPATTVLPPNLPNTTKAGTVLMAIDIFINTVKTEHYFIVSAIVTNNFFSNYQIKISNILFCVLCAAFEISALVLFCKDDPTEVVLIVLVCVILVINIIELVFYCLPIEPSHELKNICDHSARACSDIHMVLSYAVIFVGVLKTENRKESWLVIVVIAYAVFILVSVIRTFIVCIYGDQILKTRKTGASERCKRQSISAFQEELNAGQMCVIAVSGVLLLGALLFTVAVIVVVIGGLEKYGSA